MKEFILGVGGVGGYYGGVLAKAEHDVTFVARGAQYEALKQNGIRVRGDTGEFTINPVKVVEDIASIESPSLILFTVKTYDTESVARELSKVVTDESIIITLQNGVDNDLQIKKYIKNASVFPGITYVISKRSEPGVIEQTGERKTLVFGDRDNPDNEKLKEIEISLKSAGIDARLSDDITRDVWMKFMFICPYSGITGMYRRTIGEIMSNQATKKEYEEALSEAIAVGKSFGVNIPDDAFETIMRRSGNIVQTSKSSLLTDIENGRRTEIESLSGALVAMAKEVGVKVPVNERIYKTISSF